MLIGIEASRANRPQKTGVEWYAYHLIQRLKELPESQNHSWMLYSNAPLSNGLEKGPENWHEMRFLWPPKYLWTQIRLTWEMWRRPPEMLFVPAHVLPRVIPRRTVVTIHDVGFRRFPDLYKPVQRWYHEWSTKDIVKRASRIITVSEFSKREIVELYGANPEKIHVTYLGVDHDRFHPLPEEQTEAVLSRFNIAEPFLLFVGRLEKKKNIGLIIDAFQRHKSLRGLGDPLQLVLAGPQGVGFAAYQAMIEKSPARDAIRLIGYVTEEEKAALLNRAAALVHPAWYEGFCLPPLEAMACGCPVLCSHTASIPEVVGEGNALWFDPNDAETLAQGIARLMNEPALVSALRARGLEWVKRYQWTETARQTYRVLTQW